MRAQVRHIIVLNSAPFVMGCRLLLCAINFSLMTSFGALLDENCVTNAGRADVYVQLRPYGLVQHVRCGRPSSSGLSIVSPLSAHLTF
jgi:hypothetical protein